MDERLGRIEARLEKIVDIQTAIQIDVAEHIRRTGIAEENIATIAKEIKPIQEHIAFIRGLGKLGTVALAVLTSIATLWQLISGGK